MSIDKEKLKALAEAATVGRNYDRLDSAGGGLKYTCTGDDGSLVLQVDHKNDNFGFIGPNYQADEAFFLSATPAVVLSLLAEIDKLRAENEDLKKRVEELSPFRGAPLSGQDTRCLECGGFHYGLSGLPCPSMKVTAS